MKFIPLRDFDIVTSALNFDTADCQVSGGCDLYTTKAAGSDKKLYKMIDKSLESQHAALLKLGASLSPPQRAEMAASHNLTRASPFGNLAETASRRTFAYLIATLNASHPDYDFSHVLRPADFLRERNLRKVMSLIDSTLSNVRPSSLVLDGPLGGGNGGSSSSSGMGISSSFGEFGGSRSRGGFSGGTSSFNGGGGSSFGGGLASSFDSSSTPTTSALWGPQMWALIHKEMHLQDCTIFSYQPADNPFDEEDGAIWAMHYFFFNKTLKRVAYLYVRGVPVLTHSPPLLPRHFHHRRLSHLHNRRPYTGSPISISGSRQSRIAHRRGSRSSRRMSGGGGGGAAAADSALSGTSAATPTVSSRRPLAASSSAKLTKEDSTVSVATVASNDSVGTAADGVHSTKRVGYWLGEQYAGRVLAPGDLLEDDDEEMDDVLLWRPDDDSEMDEFYGKGGHASDFRDFEDDDDDTSVLETSEEEEEEEEERGERKGTESKANGARRGLVRAMSEEIVARMDME